MPTSYEVNNILGLSTSIDYTDNSTFRQIKLDTLSTEENYLANIDYNKQVGDIYLSDLDNVWYGSSVTLVLKEPLGRYHLVPVCYATPGDEHYNYEGMRDIYYAIVTDKFYLYDNDAGICRSLQVQPGTVLDSLIVNDNYAEESAAIYNMKFYDSYYGLETTTYNLSDNVTMDTSIMACNYAGTGIYPTDLVIPDYVTTIKDNVLAPVDRFYYRK